MRGLVLVRECRDEVFFQGDRCRVIPVCPQPHVRFVALLEAQAPFWITDQLVTPVLFEIRGDTTVFFCDYLIGRVTFDDLRLRVGDLWIPVGRFFVASSEIPLAPDTSSLGL